MTPGASAHGLSGRVDVPCFRVSLLSIGGVIMCVLVCRSDKPIEIFFMNLCSAMSVICGCVMGSVNVMSGGDIDSEGRPLGSLAWFGP